MIEVEIRGRLDQAEFDRLKNFLEKNGKYIESHHREMYLLQGYPGYSHDFVNRDTDVRLRDTDGKCEIMVKHKAADGGAGRHEVSLALKDDNLENAKEVVKALGYKQAIKMIRDKDMYEHKGIEWSLVRAPKGVMYYEAEKAIGDKAQIAATKEELIEEAKALDLEILDEKGTQEFIAFLDREVNEVVEL